MSYKGRFTPTNLDKYIADPKKIRYLSLWERNCFRWIDKNPMIVKWSSEEVVIPYICGTDQKKHRYFIDLFFITNEGKKFLIEIKPDKETRQPVGKNKRSKRYITESLTYIKNQSKWKAAEEFARDNDATFQVWTEKTLKSLGIRLN